MNGSLTPLTYPSNRITVVCDECGRAGNYSSASLVNRFGGNVPIPDILNAITKCERNRRLSIDRCKAYFVELRSR